VVPNGAKAPGFVRLLCRSRGGQKASLGARGQAMPLRAIGCHAVRQGCPPPIPSRPLVPRAEAWSSRGDRQSGSSTPNRVTGALPPAGLRWPSVGAHTPRAGKRAAPRVCSIFTLVAEADGRFPACRNPSAAEGAPGRGMPVPFMRSGWKRLEGSVRGKLVRARRRNNKPAHRASRRSEASEAP
jgi:hypothetical protein